MDTIKALLPCARTGLSHMCCSPDCCILTTIQSSYLSICFWYQIACGGSPMRQKGNYFSQGLSFPQLHSLHCPLEKAWQGNRGKSQGRGHKDEVVGEVVQGGD